jgi:hypothetical protein
MGLGIQTYLYNEFVISFVAPGKSEKEPMSENLYPVLLSFRAARKNTPTSLSPFPHVSLLAK